MTPKSLLALDQKTAFQKKYWSQKTNYGFFCVFKRYQCLRFDSLIHLKVLCQKTQFWEDLNIALTKLENENLYHF